MSDHSQRSFGIAQLSTGALFAVIGFVAGIGFDYYTFSETQKTGQKIEELRLARDMYNEFFVGRPIHKDMRTLIESCKPLYKSWGGPFTHDEINQYLGFFEDLGYFEREGFLSTGIIAHYYGAYMIEAYENAELQKYVRLLRKNAFQPDAFKLFYAVSEKMKTRDEFADLVSKAKTMCMPQDEESGK